MEQFHDGNYVRLRSRRHAVSPHRGGGGEGATLGRRRTSLKTPGYSSCACARSAVAPPAEQHMRLRSRAHAVFPQPGDGSEGAALSPCRAPLETPLPPRMYHGDTMYARATTSAPAPAAERHGGCDDKPPEASTVDIIPLPLGAIPTPFRVHTPPLRADEEYCMRRRRAGDDAKASIRVGLYDWVVERRHVQAASAGGDVQPHGSDSSVSSAGEMCAPSDIFLVMPRNGGVPPSWFDMIRRVRLTYWVDATKRWVLTRLGHGDPSVVIPMGWSWHSVMGQTLVYQTGGADGLGDGSCVICSCVMCIQAQHRLAFERRHGAGSFPYEISSSSVLQVKSECQRRGVWEPGRGTCPEHVLTLIKDRDIGLECRDAPGWHKCYLRFNRYVVIPRATLGAMDAASLMRLYGPVVGSLYAGEGYWRGNWDTEYVYRGEPGKVANHAVVCMGYIFRFPVPADKPELHLEVLDNQRVNGPPRWILYEAFSYFTYIQVEALNRGEMQQTPPHNTFMRILRVIAKIIRYLLGKILFWM